MRIDTRAFRSPLLVASWLSVGRQTLTPRLVPLLSLLLPPSPRSTASQCFEKRLWPEQHPLWQFDSVLRYEVLRKLEERHLSMERLADMEAAEIGAALRHPAAGAQVADCVAAFPSLHLEASLHPITRTVLRVQLSVTPTFKWKDA